MFWIFRKRTPEFQPLQFFTQYGVPVVGIWYYQRAISKIKKNQGLAKLVCENNNEFDSNAIKIVIDGRKVGYLSRDNAIKHREYLDRLHRHEFTMIVGYFLNNNKLSLKLNYDQLS